ncbi:MAG TPA: hypothetical protein VGF39_01340 [Stellaceae bacterium]|jgi:ABC-type multidrug transport system ATPase subunit
MNRERGITVFITIHNIEEVDDLCHGVGVIEAGRLVPIDTPRAARSPAVLGLVARAPVAKSGSF